MKNYKLREGENSRKPSVKRDLIEIRVPVLLLCLALAFLVWLYIVSISKIDPTDPLETLPETGEETAFALAEPRDADPLYTVSPVCAGGRSLL